MLDSLIPAQYGRCLAYFGQIPRKLKVLYRIVISLYSITCIMAPPRLRIDGKTFKDPQNREVALRGINVAGEAKYPASPDMPTYISDKFFDADEVSFVNRPFPLEDAHKHFSKLRKWGYNTIRYVFTWEAIEHAGPGIYDNEWIAFTIEVLRIAKQYDFYIFMDPHQDVVRSLLVASVRWSAH